MVPSKRSKGSFSDIGWSTKTRLSAELENTAALPSVLGKHKPLTMYLSQQQVGPT